jgi:hypothetical protein
MRGRHAAFGVAMLALALGGCGDGGEAASSDGENPKVAPLEVSGGGSAQFRIKGADNSIANYGVEAPRAGLGEAARVAHGYFAALAREEWAAACLRLSANVMRGAERLAGVPRRTDKGCAAALAVLFGKVKAAEGREATAMDAVSLRQRGAQGFLIYRGARGKPFFASLVREDGDWAVAGLSPTPLSQR